MMWIMMADEIVGDLAVIWLVRFVGRVYTLRVPHTLYWIGH